MGRPEYARPYGYDAHKGISRVISGDGGACTHPAGIPIESPRQQLDIVTNVEKQLAAYGDIVYVIAVDAPGDQIFPGSRLLVHKSR